jgi:hypothetical protein
MRDEATEAPTFLDSPVRDSCDSLLDSSDAAAPAVYWYRGPLRLLYVVCCGVLVFLNLLALIIEHSVLGQRPTCLAMVILSFVLYSVLSLYLTVYLPYYTTPPPSISSPPARRPITKARRSGRGSGGTTSSSSSYPPSSAFSSSAWPSSPSSSSS